MLWRDRSRHGNDIVNFNYGKFPRVQLDDVGPIVEINDPDVVLGTRPGPELRFGFEDFTILMLARCDSGTGLGTLFDRVSPTRPRTGIRLFCNHHGIQAPANGAADRMVLALVHDDQLDQYSAGSITSVNAFTPGVLRLVVVRRVATEIQLRVNGVLEGRTVIPGSLSLMAETPTFIGALATAFANARTELDGGIAAVVIVRGPLDDEELSALETFLVETSGPRIPPP